MSTKKVIERLGTIVEETEFTAEIISGSKSSEEINKKLLSSPNLVLTAFKAIKDWNPDKRTNFVESISILKNDPKKYETWRDLVYDGETEKAIDMLKTGNIDPAFPSPKDGNSNALLFAATEGHAELVTFLLQFINPISPPGEMTALQVAAHTGRLDCVKLLERLSDVKAQDKAGNNALLLSATNNHIAVVEYLLPNSDIAAQNKGGQDALMTAALNGRLEIVKLILGSVHPPPPSLAKAFKNRQGNGMNALHMSCVKGFPAVTELLLKFFDPKEKTSDGKTPLILAACSGVEGCVDVLLAVSDPNEVDDKGWNALIYASEKGFLGIVQKLIPHTVVDTQEEDGFTALMFAGQNGHEGVCASLLAEGKADPTLQECDGFTALAFAALNARGPAVKVLASKETGSIRNNDGSTPLMFAANVGSVGCIQALLPFSEIDAVDPNGYTALMYATQSGHLKATVELLKAGADKDIKNSDGHSAVEFVSVQGNRENRIPIIELLIGGEEEEEEE